MDKSKEELIQENKNLKKRLKEHKERNVCLYSELHHSRQVALKYRDSCRDLEEELYGEK